MFAKVENGVTKWCQNENFRRKSRKKRNFGLIFPVFWEQDRLLFARFEIGVTEFPTKIACRVPKPSTH